MTEEPTVSHLNGVLMRARGKGNTVGLSQCMNVQNGGRQVWVSWFQMWSGSISTKASFFLMKENYGNFFIPDLSHVNPHTSARAHTHTHTHTHTHLPHLRTPIPTGYHFLFHACTHLLMQVAESTPLIYTKAGPLTDPYTAPRAWRRETMLRRLAP